jgi:formylglycine-generating enzyme required for sulfatase activity
MIPFPIKLPGSEATMTFLHVRKGSFLMGSHGAPWPDEEPVHRVKIAHDFWLGETPVTQAQFAVWTKSKRVEHANGFPGHPTLPAENMSWHDAVGFCRWMTESAVRNEIVLPPGMTAACLPTEAEWEYACRAGSITQYQAGDGEEALDRAGWYEKNAGGATHPVGQKEPNAWGFRDLHGNVWEWCHDLWDGARYRGEIDGDQDPGAEARMPEYREGISKPREADQLRVLRGGSWNRSAEGCRSAFRYRGGPGVRFRGYGFRVCLVPSL